MAVDMFLKIDGIEGDARDARHKGEIEILSFSWGATNTASHGTGGGGGAGKVVAGDFSIMKALDKATPKLFERMCEGSHLPEVNVSVGSASVKGEQVEFLKIKLTDVLISSYQTGGSGGALPVESLSFNFRGVDISTADRKGNFQSISCNFGSSTGGDLAGHGHD